MPPRCLAPEVDPVGSCSVLVQGPVDTCMYFHYSSRRTFSAGLEWYRQVPELAPNDIKDTIINSLIFYLNCYLHFNQINVVDDKGHANILKESSNSISSQNPLALLPTYTTTSTPIIDILLQ